jgi:hypothetical protein
MGMTHRHYGPPGDILELFESGMDRPQPLWVKPKLGPALNLGAGYKHIDGATEYGLETGWEAGTRLPYDDETVGVIYSYHLLEHLGKKEMLATLRECERVLRKGAPLNLVLPHYMSEGAFHDLDHKLFFTESSFRNLMENTYYDGSMPRDWKFTIGLNLIVGLNVRNLAILTQLIKTQ